jgi:nucleotide-binding universal stress UspA family protein
MSRLRTLSPPTPLEAHAQSTLTHPSGETERKVQNILVPLTGFENDARALEAAFSIAKRFGGRIDALRVHPDAMQIVTIAAVQQFGAQMGNVELIHALQKGADARSAAAQDAFEAFVKRHFPSGTGKTPDGVVASMQRSEGDPVRDVTAEARYRDLVVLARAPEDGDFSPDAIANILVHCGRPVLLVPDKAPPVIGAKVAVAWKQTPEAARALSAAAPILERAEKVIVLAVAESSGKAEETSQSAERLADALRHHGFTVETRNVTSDAHGAAEALVGAAHMAGADLMIMGAYGHGRLRELVFGGVTRRVLQTCDLPLLMLH